MRIYGAETAIATIGDNCLKARRESPLARSEVIRPRPAGSAESDRVPQFPRPAPRLNLGARARRAVRPRRSEGLESLSSGGIRYCLRTRATLQAIRFPIGLAIARPLPDPNLRLQTVAPECHGGSTRLSLSWPPYSGSALMPGYFNASKATSGRPTENRAHQGYRSYG